jgi:hypothetical protein
MPDIYSNIDDEDKIRNLYPGSSNCKGLQLEAADLKTGKILEKDSPR